MPGGVTYLKIPNHSNETPSLPKEKVFASRNTSDVKESEYAALRMTSILIYEAEPT